MHPATRSGVKANPSRSLDLEHTAEPSQKSAGRSLVASTLAAVGASLCCAGPLVLASLGMGGAWLGRLTAFEPYRPYFLAVAVGFLAFAFRRIYLAPRAQECGPGGSCAGSPSNRTQKILFWAIAALVLLALGLPYLAPLFY